MTMAPTRVTRFLVALTWMMALPTMSTQAESILDRMPNTTIGMFAVKTENGMVDRFKKINGDDSSSLSSDSPIDWISEEAFKNVTAFGGCMKQFTPAGMTVIVEFNSADSAGQALAEHSPEETEIEGVQSFAHNGMEILVKRNGATLYLAPSVAGPESLKSVDVFKKSVTTVMNADALKAFEAGDFFFWLNMPKIRPLLSIGLSAIIGMEEQQANAQKGIQSDAYIHGRRLATETAKGFRSLLMETSELHGYARVGDTDIQAHVRMGWEKGKYFDGVLKSSGQTTTDLLKGLPADKSAFVVGTDVSSWSALLTDMVNVGFKRVLSANGGEVDAELLKNIETALAKASFLKNASQLSLAVVPSKEDNNAVVGRFHSSDDANAFNEIIDLLSFGRDLAKDLGEGNGLEEAKISDEPTGKRAVMASQDQSMHITVAQIKSGLFWGVGQKIETLKSLSEAGDKDIDPTSAVGQILAKMPPKASVVVLLNARQLQTLALTRKGESDEASETTPMTPGLAGVTLAVRDSGFDLDGYFPADFLQNVPDPPTRTTSPLDEEAPGEEPGDGPPEF